MANIYSTSGGTLNYLRMISDNLESNHFTISNSKNVMFALNYLKRFFGTTTEETVILTGLLSTKYNSDYDFVTISGIAKNFNTTPFRILEFSEEIESLINKNLIKFHQTEPSNIKVYVINENVLQAINKNDSSILKGEAKKEIYTMNLIEPNKIKETKLIYSSEIENDINLLEESLSDKKFMEIQNRLEEKGMSKGITIMLHGYSGTGKTETVYQMAKKTNRPILYADFGSIISKYIGETEQNISKLFKEYQTICTAFSKEGKNVPILLINEADTFFGKRSSSAADSNWLSVNNRIQSLLLDLMDSFNGIMIITTNIAENFDQAFERRFLYKIKFEKPNEEMRKLMWKSKIFGLSDESAEKIAKKYDFSGGQIQNIVKKITLNEILSGHKNKDEEIDALCKTEKLNKQGNHHIGFVE